MTKNVGVLFLLCMLLIGASMKGQVLKIVSAENNQAITGVHVLSGDHVLTTDALGQVDLKAIAATDDIIFSHTSYEDTTVTKNALQFSGFTLSLFPSVITMPAFNVYSAREKTIDVPQKVQTIALKEIEGNDPRTAADMLEKSGNIFIQRSQLGGGSPIIRGFEANRILLVVDGVRLNNAIYRSGHLQNAITVDANILAETEVIYGPGSLIYGSDALGGVIHFKTKTPVLASNDTTKLQSVKGMLRYSSAAKESTAHVDFNLGGKKLSWLSSFTFSRFDDLRMGSRRSHGDADWGLVPNFVYTSSLTDSIRENQDPLIQVGTGYDQTDLYQKVLYAINDSISFTLAAQYSTSSDVPRFDRLNDLDDDGILKFAEWNYGPQNRLMLSGTFDILSSSKAFDKANAVFAYQRIDEDRINRRFNNDERVIRSEDVQVLSLNVDLTKLMANKDLYYGVQMTSNDVASSASTYNIATTQFSEAATRYPDGGSSMSSIEAYVSLVKKVSKKFRYNTGLRYSHIYLNSEFKDTTFFQLPFSEVIFDNGAFTGSLGATYKLTEHLQLDAIGSTGFRSPNVDDYGKVFERDGLVVVPNDFLGPEYTLNGELGIGYKDDKKTELRLTGFYTHILDAIVQREYSLNSSDSLVIDGETARIVTNMNASEAMIYGIDLSGKLSLSDRMTGVLNGTYTVGEELETGLPLAHIPPFFAKADLSYDVNAFELGAYVMYSSAKTANSIAPGRTDNPNEGLNGEFPSWYTLNLRFSYSPTNLLDLNIGIENLLDEHYKSFASGLSAPGRNIVFSIRTGL